MKILINGLQLSKNLSGVQYYIENYLTELTNQKPDNFDFKVIIPKSHNSKISPSSNISFFESPIYTKYCLFRIGYENMFLKSMVTENNINILHSPAYVLPFFWKYNSIITVHDIIALQYPELCSKKNAYYFNTILPRSIKQANRIIAVSNQVKLDIMERLNIPDKKIKVIHHGIPERFRPITDKIQLQHVVHKYRLPQKFILFVGNIEPKKNLETLIEAFTYLVKKKQLPHHLVIVGQVAWKSKKLMEMINNNPYKHKILMTGYVDEKDLPAIYNLADLLTLPSLYEGFGYPVLESMACGTPVICSNRGAAPEISGGHSLLVDPQSKKELINGISKLVHGSTIRQNLISHGLKWASNFTMEKQVTSTLQLYTELC